MSNFVTDNTDLPDGKSDLRPLTGTPSKYVTAAEWNTVMQALYDLRDALPSSSVAGYVNPSEFGAVGDGLANDTAAVQAAFDAAYADRKTVLLEGGKRYRVITGLRFGTGLGEYCHLDGRGGTIVYDGPVTTAVITIDNDIARFKNLFVVASRAALYCYDFKDASTSIFDTCDALQALVDGFHSDQNNDRCLLLCCSARICGMVYHTSGYSIPPSTLRTLVTATVAKTAGTFCVVSVDSGTFNFNTARARAGDLISLHATTPGIAAAEWLQIKEVAVDGLSVSIDEAIVSSGAASGLQFTLHVGDGFHEGPGRADNNLNNYTNCLAQNAAGAGFHFGGLYGPRCVNIQVNACYGYPVVIGAPSRPTIGSSFNGVYFEVCYPVGNFCFGGAVSCSVDTANVEEDSFPTVLAGGYSSGILTNFQSGADPNRLDPIAGAQAPSYFSAMRVGSASEPSEPTSQCILAGKLRSRNYSFGANNSPGGGYFEMNDASAGLAAVDFKSGCANFYIDPMSAYRYDTDFDLTNTDAITPINEARLLNKHHTAWKNFGAFKAGIGVFGDLRTVSVDKSGTPGNVATDLNSMPAGRFAMAAGASTVTITNRLCVASTKVFLSKIDLDATATDFKVEATTGSFTVTANANATADVVFDFFLVNAGT